MNLKGKKTECPMVCNIENISVFDSNDEEGKELRVTDTTSKSEWLKWTRDQGKWYISDYIPFVGFSVVCEIKDLAYEGHIITLKCTPRKIGGIFIPKDVYVSRSEVEDEEKEKKKKI